jgi:hypothetical protein
VKPWGLILKVMDMPRLGAAIGSLLFLLIAPGTGAGLVPLKDTTSRFRPIANSSRCLGHTTNNVFPAESGRSQRRLNQLTQRRVERLASYGIPVPNPGALVD